MPGVASATLDGGDRLPESPATQALRRADTLELGKVDADPTPKKLDMSPQASPANTAAPTTPAGSVPPANTTPLAPASVHSSAALTETLQEPTPAKEWSQDAQPRDLPPTPHGSQHDTLMRSQGHVDPRSAPVLHATDRQPPLPPSQSSHALQSVEEQLLTQDMYQDGSYWRSLVCSGKCVKFT